MTRPDDKDAAASPPLKAPRPARAPSRSPVALAEAAAARGDRLLRVALEEPTDPSRATARADPSEVLNAICMRGWELVGASFVFVPQRHHTHPGYMSRGQETAIAGKTVGYYVFRRST